MAIMCGCGKPMRLVEVPFKHWNCAFCGRVRTCKMRSLADKRYEGKTEYEKQQSKTDL